MSTRSFKPKLTKPAAPAPVLFSRLTKPQQRVAIAQDAIDQLTITKVYSADTGAFLIPPDLDGDGDLTGDARPEAPTTLRAVVQTATKEKPCTVCAMGAIFASQAMVNGDCKLDELDINSWNGGIMPFEADGDSDNTFHPFITRYFSIAQLQLIEIAFEHGSGGFAVAGVVDDFRDFPDDRSAWADDWADARDDYGLKVSIKAADRAMAFGERYEDSTTKRLLAILGNVVENGGTFVP